MRPKVRDYFSDPSPITFDLSAALYCATIHVEFRHCAFSLSNIIPVDLSSFMLSYPFCAFFAALLKAEALTSHGSISSHKGKKKTTRRTPTETWGSPSSIRRLLLLSVSWAYLFLPIVLLLLLLLLRPSVSPFFVDSDSFLFGRTTDCSVGIKACLAPVAENTTLEGRGITVP